MIWYFAFHFDYAHTKGQIGEILHLIKPQHYAHFAYCKTNKKHKIPHKCKYTLAVPVSVYTGATVLLSNDQNVNALQYISFLLKLWFKFFSSCL